VRGAKIHIAKTATKNIFSRSTSDILATCELREQVDQDGYQASQKAANSCAQRNVFKRLSRPRCSAEDQADDAPEDGYSSAHVSQEIGKRVDCRDGVEHLLDAEKIS
jgi:hypothetical protein